MITVISCHHTHLMNIFTVLIISLQLGCVVSQKNRYWRQNSNDFKSNYPTGTPTVTLENDFDTQSMDSLLAPSDMPSVHFYYYSPTSLPTSGPTSTTNTHKRHVMKTNNPADPPTVKLENDLDTQSMDSFVAPSDMPSVHFYYYSPTSLPTSGPTSTTNTHKGHVMKTNNPADPPTVKLENDVDTQSMDSFLAPSDMPSVHFYYYSPTSEPTVLGSDEPTLEPTLEPSKEPSLEPTVPLSTLEPTSPGDPSITPTLEPTILIPRTFIEFTVTVEILDVIINQVIINDAISEDYLTLLIAAILSQSGLITSDITVSIQSFISVVATRRRRSLSNSEKRKENLPDGLSHMDNSLTHNKRHQQQTYEQNLNNILPSRKLSAPGYGNLTLEYLFNVVLSEDLGVDPTDPAAPNDAYDIVTSSLEGDNYLQYLHLVISKAFQVASIRPYVISAPIVKVVTPSPTRHPTKAPVSTPTVTPVASSPPGSVSKNPTRRPNARPTSYPTMLPSAVPVPANCIEFTLVDLYGDGWGSGSLLLYSSRNEHFEYSPSCLNNPLVANFCFDPSLYKDGDTLFVKIIGFRPSNAWEIFWSVRLSTGSVFYGDYDTMMSFALRSSSQGGSSIWVSASSNLFKPSFTCDECTSSAMDVPSVVTEETPESATDILNQAKKGVVWSQGKPISSSSSVTVSTTVTTPATSSSPPAVTVGTNPVTTSPVAANPVAGGSQTKGSGHDKTRKKGQGTAASSRRALYSTTSSVEFDLIYKQSGYSNSVYGPKYYLLSDDNSLMVTGSLCKTTASSTCGMSLDDGLYSLRISGGVDRKGKLSWDFCGVTGSQASEVKFSILNQKCVVKGVNNVVMKCTKSSQSSSQATSLQEYLVHIDGVLKIEGNNSGDIPQDMINTQSLSELELATLKTAITDEFNDAKLTSSKILYDATSIRVIEGLDNSKARKLEDQPSQSAFHVGFRVSVSVQGDLLVNNFKSYLDKSMTSGLFISRINALINVHLNEKSIYQNSNEHDNEHSKLGVLRKSNKITLVDLQIIHQMIENKEFSMISSVTVIVFGLIGMLFLMLGLRKIVMDRKSRFRYSLASTSETGESSSAVGA